ncbi:hypothetical protein FACS1894219_09010 [Clostridia bacterium]|nr:hypothetical protein FACS1894219_09010 [Clostridia bacterium]
MNKILSEVCKKLHFSSSLLAKAKRIEEKPNLEFLLELFAAEIEEREIKRRNANIKYACFDIIKHLKTTLLTTSNCLIQFQLMKSKTRNLSQNARI